MRKSPIMTYEEFKEKVGSVISFVSERMGFIQEVIGTVAPLIGDIISTAWGVISPVIDIVISRANGNSKFSMNCASSAPCGLGN